MAGPPLCPSKYSAECQSRQHNCSSLSLSVHTHTHTVLPLFRTVTLINSFLLKGAELTIVACIILAVIDEISKAFTWNI